jgi:hypothetical protein
MRGCNRDKFTIVIHTQTTIFMNISQKLRLTIADTLFFNV